MSSLLLADTAFFDISSLLSWEANDYVLAQQYHSIWGQIDQLNKKEEIKEK